MYQTKCINYYNVFPKQFDWNEYFSPFEFSSARIKIGIWINSARLNNLGRPLFKLGVGQEKFGVWFVWRRLLFFLLLLLLLLLFNFLWSLLLQRNKTIKEWLLPSEIQPCQQCQITVRLLCYMYRLLVKSLKSVTEHYFCKLTQRTWFITSYF